MSLESLRKQILTCRKCRLWRGAKNAVPGEGPTNARVMLVGQNPGSEEDRVGKPFVGRTGRYLDSVMKKNEVIRADFFITGIVKHITPNNRFPWSDEIAACLPYVVAQIEAICPEVVLLMGRAACQTPRRKSIIFLETVHPSAAMRFPVMRQRFEADFAALIKQFPPSAISR